MINIRTSSALTNLKGTKQFTFVVGSTADCDYIYNGVDIAVAINAAITALPGTGGIIYIKAGTYLINGVVNMNNKANLQIIGAGMEHVTIQASGRTTEFFNLYSTAYRYKYVVKGMTLDNTTAAVGSIGFKLGLLSDAKFEDLCIRNFDEALELNDGMFYNNFWNVKTENCRNDVVISDGPIDKPNSNFFNGCKFLADSDNINGVLGSHNCVTINSGNQNSFIACQFENFTRAAYVNDIGNTFISNRIESNDVTAAVTYITLTANAQNNQFGYNYYSGNDYVDFPTSVINNGAGNGFWEGNTFKGQTITFERNILTAGPVALFKRTGSGNNEAIITAEDTYAPSGSPINFLARTVRAAAKVYQATLNGVENFYVSAQGQAYFAGGLLLNNQRIQSVALPTSGTDAVNKNYVDNPFTWTPENYGYISWNYDPAVINNNTLLTNGACVGIKLRVPRATTITNIIINIGASGAGLNDCYVALFQSNNLLAQSANQTDWNATGNKVIPLSSPQAVSAGTVDVVVWCGTSSSGPGLARSGSQAGGNGGLTGTNLRWFTANTGLTTTAPATLGTRTTSNNTFWAAIS